MNHSSTSDADVRPHAGADYPQDPGAEMVPVTPAAEHVWEEIKRLDLTYHVAELECLGYTVVPPEKVGSPEFVTRLREAILDVAERRTGKRPVEGAEAHNRPSEHFGEGFGQTLPFVTFEDPVFQEALLNPVCMALMTYLLGAHATLYNVTATIKGKGTGELGLHCDNRHLTSPFPPHTQVANATFALTDYTLEGGALAFVPGSHRYYRHPNPGEGVDQRIAVVAPAGSMIVWGGGTWHGAFERTAPGWRINLIMAMARSHIRPQESYSDAPQDIIDRNPPRFATLVGKHVQFGWKEEGPQHDIAIVSRHVYD